MVAEDSERTLVTGRVEPGASWSPSDARAAAPVSYRALLGNRNYRLYFLASLISSLGDWAGLFALQILVNSLIPGTRLALFALGGVMMARLVPGVVFGPVAGVLADRYDRKRLMVFSDVIRGLLFGGIALSDDLAALLAFTFIVECLSLVFGAAKEATLPTIVPRNQLQEANQLNLLVVYGPIPLGALLPAVLALVGNLRAALVVNAVSFLLSAVLTSRLHLPQRRPLREREESGGGFLEQLRGGLSFIGERPIIRSLITGVAGIFFGAGVIVTLGPVLVSDELNRPETDWSLLATAVGLGVAVGIIGVRWATRRVQKAKVFPWSLAVTGGLACVVAFLNSFALTLAAGFFMGVAVGFSFVIGYTLLHESTPDEVRARTFASFYTVTRVSLFAALAVTPLVAGAIPRLTLSAGTDRVSLSGVRAAMLAGGLIGLAAAWSAGRGMYRAVREEPSREFHLPIPEQHTVPTGVFIAFEGVEGAGKSTQVRALVERLRAEGRDVVVTREPGGPPVSERIRDLLLDPSGGSMHARTEALLYAAARSEHLQRVVLPALKTGKVVISDRFVDSSLAYQGFGRGLGADDVGEINRWALNGVMADAVILLDLDPAHGLERVAQRTAGDGHGKPDRIESEELAFHQRVADGYHELARRQPGRYLVVDATGPADEVAQQIRVGLDPVLPLPETQEEAGKPSTLDLSDPLHPSLDQRVVDTEDALEGRATDPRGDASLPGGPRG